VILSAGIGAKVRRIAGRFFLDGVAFVGVCIRHVHVERRVYPPPVPAPAPVLVACTVLPVTESVLL